MRGDGTSVPFPGNYELLRILVVTQARLLAFIDICFCLAVAAAICLAVLAITRWRQLREVLEHHTASIVVTEGNASTAFLEPPALRGFKSCTRSTPRARQRVRAYGPTPKFWGCQPPRKMASSPRREP